MSGHSVRGCRFNTRRGVPGVVLLLGAVCLLPAWSQVGPGRENVKPVGPSKTNVQRPPRRKPVIIRPVPPDPRVAAARAWQDEELRNLRALRQALTLVSPPRPDLIPLPVEPELPRPKTPEVTYRQRASLLLLREDGQPLDARMAQVAAPGFDLKVEGGRVLLDAPASQSPQGEVRLALPADYAFKNPGESRISFRETPGEETRQQLESRRAPEPEAPAAPPLFASDTDRAEAIRRIPPGRPAPARRGRTPYPTPAAQTLAVVTRLIEAYRFLGPTVPVSPEASPDARRAAWTNLQQASRLLRALEQQILAARNEIGRLSANSEPARLLKDVFQDTQPELQATLARVALRRAQYGAEIAWWLASCESPGAPDRAPAIAAAEAARGMDRRAVETAALVARMREVSERENTIREQIAAGVYRPLPEVRTLVTRQLERTIVVSRTVIDLRLAREQLLAGDVVTLSGDPARRVEFTLQGNAWLGRIPAARPAAAVLRVSRRNANSDLEAEIPLHGLSPYAPSGNEVSRGAFRLLAIRAHGLAGEGLQRADVLEELEPADADGARLRDARRKAAKSGRPTADGGWWVSGDDGQLFFRLRPSPYPPDSAGSSSGGLGKRVGSFLRRVAGGASNKGPTGRVIVDAARLEGASAGHVAGVRVGANEAAVENALGGVVPRNGVVRYAGGAVEIGMRAGQVEYIEIYRNLGEMAGTPITPAGVGTVTEIRHQSNRLRALVGPEFPAPPGSEFEVWVAGRPLEAGGGDYRALVLDSTRSEVVCKLIRKNSKGGVAGDAEWDVLRSLPAGDAGVVVLKRPE